MNHFRKMLILFLVMAMTLLSAVSLGEEGKSGEEEAFETLRSLMEEPLSDSIPPIEGHSLYAEVVTVSESKNPTPVDIVCQFQVDFEKNEYTIINSAINDVPGSELSDGDDPESENTETDDETFVKYEAVTYSDLSQEQFLYYAYVIGSNYNTIQNQLPFGMTFLIVVKYGDSDLIMINDEATASEFTKTIVDIVTSLAGE